jgi:hypothetical protein
MALSNLHNQIAVSVLRVLSISMIFMVPSVGSPASAQAQAAQQGSSDESWTATTELSGGNMNPSRTTQSHNKSGERSVDKQRVEVLGLDGRYRPDSETETETVRVNDTTTRTVVRAYRWDGNGRRTLAQVTEEETRSTSSGDGQAVRTTSSSDVNGNLHIVKREVTDTKKTGPDAQETKTKVYVSDGYGGLTMALQTQELKNHNADDSVETKKTTLVLDGNGNWKVGEVKDNTIKEDGKNRTNEERISRPDLEGRLSEVSRTVAKETENDAGGKTSTVDTYSRNAPGSGYDNDSMHRTQRVTTVQKKESDGEITEQQVEQPKWGNPSDSPQVTAKTKYTVRYAASGSDTTRTVQVHDANGAFKVISVETRKSDQVPATQVPPAPSYKPQ